MPRVFMTTDRVGGVWTYATDIVAGLADRGIDVTLAILGPSQGDTPPSHPRVAIIDTGLPLDWLVPNAETLAQTSHALAGFARQSGADLIHLNSAGYATAGFDAPVVAVCHSCLGTWWDAVRGGDVPPDFGWRTAALGAAYAACDRLVAPSEAFAAATTSRYGVRPAVVHNGRAATGLAAAKQPFVLTSGRLWDAGKNVQALDAAAALMRGEVRAAGSLHGPDGTTCTLRAATALGQLSPAALAADLARAAIFASAALYEPFGLGVLEAAQAGCALVLSDIPTFRELWSGAAIFVPARDPDVIAATLDSLLASPIEAARLGQLALDRARRFTVDAMVQGTIAVYANLLPSLRAAA